MRGRVCSVLINVTHKNNCFLSHRLLILLPTSFTNKTLEEKLACLLDRVQPWPLEKAAVTLFLKTCCLIYFVSQRICEKRTASMHSMTDNKQGKETMESWVSVTYSSLRWAFTQNADLSNANVTAGGWEINGYLCVCKWRREKAFCPEWWHVATKGHWWSKQWMSGSGNSTLSLCLSVCRLFSFSPSLSVYPCDSLALLAVCLAWLFMLPTWKSGTVWTLSLVLSHRIN